MSIDKFIDNFENGYIKALEKTTNDFTRLMELKSPVDTGLFRSSWIISVDKPNFYFKKRPKRLLKMLPHRKQLTLKKVPKIIYIQNNQPYGVDLEFGKSNQAPMGFIRINKFKLPLMLKENIKNA